MMPDEAKLGKVLFDKLENDPIVKIDAKAPNFMRFEMEFFCAQDGIEGVLFENLGFFRGLPLNLFVERVEKPVKSSGGGDLHYLFINSKRLFLFVTRPAR
ncbi:hypothetical protein L6R21_16110 [bacterium]|nr:hypothetical protein [bacterium]